MKKLTLLFLLIANAMVGQTQKIDLLKSESLRPFLLSKYTKAIDYETKDTVYYVYLGFQNEKYKSITDIKSLSFISANELEKFKSDLKSGLEQIEVSDMEMSWKRDEYTISKYAGEKRLWLWLKDDGYTLINKNQVEKIIAWLSKIEFGKDATYN